MDAKRESEPTRMKNRTTVERKSERELVVTRTFNGPARIVFEAWTKPELFKRWWVPKSMGMSLRSCEMDVHVGGKYRLEFEPDGIAFFGTYLEVTPHSRLVWTNDESGDDGTASDAVAPGAAAIDRGHEGASLDRNPEPFRFERVARDPANVMSVRSRRKRPFRRRGQCLQAAGLLPRSTGVGRAPHFAWFRAH